jgi:S1-C subfamily serine protease
VTAGSPADQAGLEGDRILTVNGTEVGPEYSLTDLIGAHQPGDSVTLELPGRARATRSQVELSSIPTSQGRLTWA